MVTRFRKIGRNRGSPSAKGGRTTNPKLGRKLPEFLPLDSWAIA